MTSHGPSTKGGQSCNRHLKQFSRSRASDSSGTIPPDSRPCERNGLNIVVLTSVKGTLLPDGFKPTQTYESLEFNYSRSVIILSTLFNHILDWFRRKNWFFLLFVICRFTNIFGTVSTHLITSNHHNHVNCNQYDTYN